VTMFDISSTWHTPLVTAFRSENEG